MVYKPELLAFQHYVLLKSLCTVFYVLGFNVKHAEQLPSQKAEVKSRKGGETGRANSSGVLKNSVCFAT